MGWSWAHSQVYFLSADPATGLLRNLGWIPDVSNYYIETGSGHLVGSSYYFVATDPNRIVHIPLSPPPSLLELSTFITLTVLDHSLVSHLSLTNVHGLRFSAVANLFFGVGWSWSHTQ